MFTVTLAELMDRADAYLEAGQPDPQADPPPPHIPHLDDIAQDLWREISRITRRRGPVVHNMAIWQYEGPPENGAVPFLYCWVANEIEERTRGLTPGSPRYHFAHVDLERELAKEEGIPLASEVRVRRSTPLPPPLPSDN